MQTPTRITLRFIQATVGNFFNIQHWRASPATFVPATPPNGDPHILQQTRHLNSATSRDEAQRNRSRYPIERKFPRTNLP